MKPANFHQNFVFFCPALFQIMSPYRIERCMDVQYQYCRLLGWLYGKFQLMCDSLMPLSVFLIRETWQLSLVSVLA